MRLFIVFSFVIAAMLLVIWFSMSVQPVGLSAPITLFILAVILLRLIYRLLLMTQQNRRHQQRGRHVKRSL